MQGYQGTVVSVCDWSCWIDWVLVDSVDCAGMNVWAVSKSDTDSFGFARPFVDFRWGEDGAG